MKYCNYLIATISVVIASASLYAEPKAAPSLSKDELQSFCSNEQIWSSFGIDKDQCLKASTTCANQNARKNISAVEATQALYDCVFDELDIQLPDQ